MIILLQQPYWEGGYTFDKQRDIQKKGNIIIGKNVFIGACSFILPGTIIENNCIIGAGSVVRGRIPSGSIAIGNPAKVVGNISKVAQKYFENDKTDYQQD